jgi:3-oxoadipate enol-lactonase
MARANINGSDVHYEVSGDGPTLVWLHGLMGSIERSRTFAENMAELAERGYRVVAYDARGHGESGYTTDEAGYSWEAHAEDMRALMDELGIERACVGGGSMGAGVSVTFALAHPERVERLVLVAPPPLAHTIGTAQQIFGALATLIESVGVERAVEIVMQLPDYVALKERDPKQYELTRDWFLGLHPKATPLAIRGLLFGPALAADRFAEIEVPALIVAHPDDPIHPTSSAERLHEAIAGSQLVVAPEQNYYREHHEELIEVVAEFLSTRTDVIATGSDSSLRSE